MSEFREDLIQSLQKPSAFADFFKSLSTQVPIDFAKAGTGVIRLALINSLYLQE